MSQNQEIIESKLCAYIDGVLDPDGRAEIEKHLQANPQHRRLLESLRATRDLIKWLPREPAPLDLAETLHGQLERSVLLDYEGDSLKLSIWPRVFAAAAIIVLTTGLAAAVFYTLPRSQRPVMAIRTGGPGLSAAKPSVGPMAAPSPSSDPDAFSKSEFGRTDAEDRAKTDAGPAISLAKAGESYAMKEQSKDATIALKSSADAEKYLSEPLTKLSGGLAFNTSSQGGEGAFAAKKNSEALDQLAFHVAQNPAVFLSRADEKNIGAPQPIASPAVTNAMVMLVRADSPEHAEKELTSYFDSQRIQWHQTQLPGNELSNSSQDNRYFNGNYVQSNGNASSADGSNEQDEHLRYKEAGGRKGNLGDIAPSASISGAAEKVKDSPGKMGFGAKSSLQTQPVLPGAVAGKAAPKPIAHSGPAINQQAEVAQTTASSAAQQQQLQERQLQQRQMDNLANNSYRSGGVYVCQVSRRQAVQLSTAISRDGVQAAELKDVSGLVPAAAEEQRSDAKQSNEDVQARGRRAGTGGGGGLGVASTQWAEQKTEPSKTAAVDGRREFSPSNELNQTSKRGVPLTTQPSEQFALHDAPKAADKAALTTESPRPTPGSAFDSKQRFPVAPFTQPSQVRAVAATAPADEPVNLVILIESNAMPAASAPASQPAGQVLSPDPAAAAQKVPDPSTAPAAK